MSTIKLIYEIHESNSNTGVGGSNYKCFSVRNNQVLCHRGTSEKTESCGSRCTVYKNHVYTDLDFTNISPSVYNIIMILFPCTGIISIYY